MLTRHENQLSEWYKHHEETINFMYENVNQYRHKKYQYSLKEKMNIYYKTLKTN